MNILLISRCPPFPLHFGDRLIPYHLARQLSERQHHIDLIAFYQRPEDSAEIPRYERFFHYINLIRDPPRGTLRYLRRMNSGEFFPAQASHAWSPEMWKAIEQQLATTNYDVVQLFGGIQVYEYRDLIRKYPNIIVPYESYSLFLESTLQQTKGGLQRWFRRQQLRTARSYEARMFEGFDRMVVLSDADASTFRNLRSDLRPVIIPNGVDTDYFVPTGIEPDTPTLIFTGNFEYAPNLDAGLRLARQIFPMIKQRVPGARLLLVGNNPPQQLLGFAGRDIEVTGRVPDLRPFLERSLVFISPLRMGAGIKNKLLEAMAMQKAIVATPLSMEGIAAQHEQHFLQATTNEEFVRAVVRLMKDGDLRQRLAGNNRALIEERYTWARVAQRYEELYREISWRRVKQ